jgi:hypothetical protein
MNKVTAEQRLVNSIMLSGCEGCTLNIIENKKYCTLGRIMECNQEFNEEQYDFTLINGDHVTLDYESIEVVDPDSDNKVVNIYIEDDFEVSVYTEDILEDNGNLHYYSRERFTEAQKYEEIRQILEAAKNLVEAGYGDIHFTEEK